MIEQKTVYTDGEASRINMSRWDINRKIHYNFTHKFSYDFLIKVGYSQYLNRGEVPDWKELESDDVGELFLKIYREEYPKEFLKLYGEMKKYFEANPKEGWVPKELYQSYLKL